MGKSRIKSGPSRRRTVARLTKPKEAVVAAYPFLTDFFTTNWKSIPQRHAYPIYALCMYADYADYVEIATESTTEGDDDKDVDFCHVDIDDGKVFVGQSYLSDEWDRPEAPANKAEDLLTGLTWLLKPELDEVPAGIREKAREVQAAIKAGDVTEIYLLYVHNCRGSQNIEMALRNVARSAKVLVQHPSVSVVPEELSLPKVQHLYDSQTKLIVVEKEVEFAIQSWFEEKGDDWKAISTTISGEKLHQLWNDHRNDLFSANVRGFLNMLNRKKSINNGMMETIQREASRFWAYNNGITILSKRLTVATGTLHALGISIINGAQTTGVIGNALPERVKEVKVPCRFVECENEELVLKMIQKNNTQNEMRAFDLRSNDPIQRRISEQFLKYNITYVHRRKGAQRLPEGAIQAETLAPYLAAFHGYFQVATRQRRSIFEDLSTYGNVFQLGISAQHLYLIQTLADAVSEIKLDIKKKKDEGVRLPKVESDIHDLLEHSTAKCFIVGLVGQLAETVLGRAISSKFSWVTAEQKIKPDRSKMTGAWKLALDALNPLIVQNVGNGISGYDIVRSQTKLLDVADKVNHLAHSIRRQLNSEFSPIRDYTELLA